MTEEEKQRALNCEWAELVGWKPMGAWFYDTDGGHHFGPIKDANDCFRNADGPWQWMKANGLLPVLSVNAVKVWCTAYLGKVPYATPLSVSGDTELEAVTACALAAHKVLEGQR